MRRLLAFLIDVTIAGLAAAIFLSLVESLTNRSLINLPIFLAVTGLFVAIFEYRHDGLTPGRLVTGINLVSTSGSSLSLFFLFIRIELLLLFPLAVTVLVEFLFYWLLKQEPFFAPSGVGDILPAMLLLFGVTFIASKGTQSFHDYVGHTAVVRTGSSQIPQRISNRTVWTCGVLSVAAITVWYFTFSYQNTPFRHALRDTQLAQDFNSALTLTMGDPKTRSLVVSPDEIGISDIDLAHNYDHAFIVTKVSPLGAKLTDLGLINEPGLQIEHSETEPVVSISVLLTARGMLNLPFQEELAKKACSTITQRTDIDVCVFNFVYYQNIIAQTYVGVARLLVTAQTFPSTSPRASPVIYSTYSPLGGLMSVASIGTPLEIYVREQSVSLQTP